MPSIPLRQLFITPVLVSTANLAFASSFSLFSYSRTTFNWSLFSPIYFSSSGGAFICWLFSRCFHIGRCLTGVISNSSPGVLLKSPGHLHPEQIYNQRLFRG